VSDSTLLFAAAFILDLSYRLASCVRHYNNLRLSTVIGSWTAAETCEAQKNAGKILLHCFGVATFCYSNRSMR
jgi:hypothetical protein